MGCITMGKILKEKEVNVSEFTTSSGSPAYRVGLAITKEMFWLRNPKASKVLYLEDDEGNPKIELIPIYGSD